MLPEKGDLKLPEPLWYNEMKTPSEDYLLAEFRQERMAVDASSAPADHALMDSNEMKPGANAGTVTGIPNRARR